MSTASGVRAAARTGIQVGPKGGHFYINSHGKKVYGVPPTVTVAVKGAPTPAHIFKGSVVDVDVEGEGRLPGVVHSVNKSKKTVVVRLRDGSLVDGSFSDVTPRAAGPNKPPTSPKPELPKFKAPEPRSEPDYDPEASAVRLPGVTHNISPSKVYNEQFVQAVKDGNFGPYLANHPITMFGGLVSTNAANASYTPPYSGTSHIKLKSPNDMRSSWANAAVTIAYTGGVEGKTPGRSPWVVMPNNSPTYEDFVRSCLVHELGHHMHLNGVLSEDLKLEIREHYIHQSSGYAPRWTPSRYSRTDHMEWFAEAHIAYVYHNEHFKKSDPTGYGLVQRARRELKME